MSEAWHGGVASRSIVKLGSRMCLCVCVWVRVLFISFLGQSFPQMMGRSVKFELSVLPRGTNVVAVQELLRDLSCVSGETLNLHPKPLNPKPLNPKPLNP